jgi:DNA repair exonuclease SbcCD ATPase subunit
MLAVLVFSLTIVPETVSAQKLSKKERKRLKKEKKKRLKEMKKMSAADFQAQQEKQDELMTKASELESQLTATKSELSAKDGQVKQLEDKVRKLQQQVTQAQAAPTEQPQNVPMAGSGEDQQYDQGLVFRVQIGAWQNQDLAAYDTSENFRDENGPDNMQMYTLGNFRDYWEADTFKKYLRKMGVRDAWIVPYENGERRPIKDVLEQLRNSASLN